MRHTARRNRCRISELPRHRYRRPLSARCASRQGHLAGGGPAACHCRTWSIWNQRRSSFGIRGFASERYGIVRNYEPSASSPTGAMATMSAKAGSSPAARTFRAAGRQPRDPRARPVGDRPCACWGSRCDRACGAGLRLPAALSVGRGHERSAASGHRPRCHRSQTGRRRRVPSTPGGHHLAHSAKHAERRAAYSL